MKKPVKILLGVAAFMLFLSLFLNVFLRWKVKDILRHIVSQFSENQYTIEAKMVVFHLEKASILATGVRIIPANKKQIRRPVELTADTLMLDMKGYFSMLFNRALRVEDARVVNPVLVLPAGEKRLGQDFSLHDKLLLTQQVVARMINTLRIDKLQIDNASIKVFADTTETRFFMTNHMFIHMDHLYSNVAANKAKGQIRIKGNIHLWLQKPQIVYPDSNLVIGLDTLDWDSQRQRIAIQNISFSQGPTVKSPDSSGFTLRTVRIKRFDWNSWANLKRIYIDSISADTGELYIEKYRPIKRYRKPLEERLLLKLLSPMKLRHFSILKLKTTAVLHTRSKPLIGGLVADSVGVNEFSIDVERSVPLQLAGLSLVVRKFEGRDLEDTWESSFSEFRVRNDSAVLKNYVLQSTENNRIGKGTRFEVPVMVMSGFSNRRILEGKLAADKMIVTNPTISIQLPGKRRQKGREAFAERTLRERLPFLRVHRLLIQNGNLSITNPKGKIPFLTAKGIDGEVDLKKLFETTSFAEKIASSGNLQVKEAELKLANENMRLYSVTIDPPQNLINVKDVLVQMHHKAGSAAFNDVTLRTYDLKRPKIEGPLRLKSLSIGSGVVDIDESKKISRKKAGGNGKRKGLRYIIDKLDAKSVKIFYRNNSRKVAASVQMASISGLRNANGKLQWKNLLVHAIGVNYATKYGDLKVGKLRLQNGGVSNLQNFRYSYQKESERVLLSAPSMQLNFPVRQLPDTVVPMVIKSATIQQPYLDYQFKNDTANLHFQGHMNRLALWGVTVRQRPDKKLSWDVARIEMNTRAMSFDNDTLSRVVVSKMVGAITGYHKSPKAPMVFAIESLMLDSIHSHHFKKERQYRMDAREMKFGKTPAITLLRDSLKGLIYTYHLLKLKGGVFIIEDSARKVQFRDVNADLPGQTLSIDSFIFRGKLPRDSVFAKQVFEKDLFTVTTGKIKGEGVRAEIVGEDSIFVANLLSVDSLNLLVERDKRVDDDTVSYRPLLARMLEKIPTHFIVDTLMLSNGRVRHNVIEEKRGQEGIIFFGDINGQIENARNVSIHDNDTLQMRLNANLMGKGKLFMQFRQSYTDSLQTFLLHACLGRYQAEDLNRILEPIASFRIKQGTIDSLWLKVKANDFFAFGKMKMDYHDLKVDVLNKKGERIGFVSWVVNGFVIRKSNKKTHYIYVERLRNKAIFNYWGKIALGGLLSNVGIRSDKRYLKDYQKTMKKYHLANEEFRVDELFED